MAYYALKRVQVMINSIRICVEAKGKIIYLMDQKHVKPRISMSSWWNLFNLQRKKKDKSFCQDFQHNFFNKLQPNPSPKHSNRTELVVSGMDGL